ncbi:MAG: GNAT family N-acetyltransferase [Nocardioides sp.]|nr:GNAT family N-acetyltransferase [Nocardioides sp.]
MDVLILPFAELSPTMAYDVWRLRQEVFVVEQDCAYLDLDGRDHEPGTLHVVLADGGAVAGTLRILDDGDVWRIGRVVLAKTARGRGLSDTMMRAALDAVPGRDVVLAAQAPLARWYATFGFTVEGDEFDEDGIPHLPMRLRR